MKGLLQLSLLLFFACSTSAQFPKIGSDKDAKEKLMIIKKALPDIKKNLTKPDVYDDMYIVNLEMGNGEIRYDENDEDQTLEITYSTDYFAGALKDFQNYYKKLAGIIKEVFGSAYELNQYDKEGIWSTEITEKGKDFFGSSIKIELKCIWLFDPDKPTIEIKIYSSLKSI